MATALGEHKPVVGRDDPRYHEGMTHLQVGEWSAAVACFEALAGEYPMSVPIAQALDQARWKVGLAGGRAIRAKRRNSPWRAIVVRTLLALLVIAVTVGVLAIRRQMAPTIAIARAADERAKQLSEAAALLDSGELNGAETLYQALLAQDPADGEAQQGLELVTSQRELVDTYRQAVAYQQAGDYPAAIANLTQVSIMAPGYRDVGVRITAIKRQQQLGGLLAEADADYEAGRTADALSKYQQLSETNESYHAETVQARLFELCLRLGRETIRQRGLSAGGAQEALDYFSRALALQPRNAEAALETKLIRLVIDGQNRFDQGAWGEAITRLRQVYDQQPEALGPYGLKMLYEAYVYQGDQDQSAGDLFLAYEGYRTALEYGSQFNPPIDTTLARGRMASLEPKLTPTPTSTPTPTPTRTPIPTATPGPTMVPTPMPLRALRNRIVFLSDNEEQAGYWVMDADGRNRRYLGRLSKDLTVQYDALIQEARHSPDGRYSLFVRDTDSGAQIFMLQPKHEQYGELAPKQLTRLSDLCYDPVWSPDGRRIAFVSQEAGSDDVWVINADGKEAKNLMAKGWEWDKHPSWSPDSQRIVFWSNRGGLRQIYTMDANGKNVRNISNTTWEEYDPIWIR
ncbi:MAG: hypothetical protein V1772_08055 [Chloroflexota bacterium]